MKFMPGDVISCRWEMSVCSSDFKEHTGTLKLNERALVVAHYDVSNDLSMTLLLTCRGELGWSRCGSDDFQFFTRIFAGTEWA